jgi:hypothetical protein
MIARVPNMMIVLVRFLDYLIHLSFQTSICRFWSFLKLSVINRFLLPLDKFSKYEKNSYTFEFGVVYFGLTQGLLWLRFEFFFNHSGWNNLTL